MSNLWIGEKIQLKPIDEEKLYDYYTSIDYQNSEFVKLVDSVNPPIPSNKIKNEIEKMIKRSGENDVYQWMIEDMEGNVVGDVGTYKCDRRNGTFMYGIAILTKYWKKGYASEAIKIMLKFYFEELRYQKVTSYVYSFNKASQKLHEKCGFKEEGRLRNMLYTEGQYYDHIYYGMTKEEFEKKSDKNE